MNKIRKIVGDLEISHEKNYRHQTLLMRSNLKLLPSYEGEETSQLCEVWSYYIAQERALMQALQERNLHMRLLPDQESK